MWSLRQDPLQLNAVTSIASILTSSIKSPLTEASQTWPHLANLQATDLFLEGPSQYKIRPCIQKTGLAGRKNPQKIYMFRIKIVLERENYQFCNVLENARRHL